MTKREICNKYLPKLILIMEDPEQAMLYCKPWSGGKMMGNLIDDMPDDKLPGLWDIVKKARYRESPKPILQEMTEELNKARQ